MTKAEKKDSILRYLINAKMDTPNGVVEFTPMANSLNIDKPQLTALCLELKESGHIAYTDGPEPACKIFPAGEYLYKHEGGFVKLDRTVKKKRTWNISKDAITIVIAALSLMVGLKQCANDNKINAMQKQIDKLSTK